MGTGRQRLCRRLWGAGQQGHGAVHRARRLGAAGAQRVGSSDRRGDGAVIARPWGRTRLTLHAGVSQEERVAMLGALMASAAGRERVSKRHQGGPSPACPSRRPPAPPLVPILLAPASARGETQPPGFMLQHLRARVVGTAALALPKLAATTTQSQRTRLVAHRRCAGGACVRHHPPHPQRGVRCRGRQRPSGPRRVLQCRGGHGCGLAGAAPPPPHPPPPPPARIGPPLSPTLHRTSSRPSCRLLRRQFLRQQQQQQQPPQRRQHPLTRRQEV